MLMFIACVYLHKTKQNWQMDSKGHIMTIREHDILSKHSKSPAQFKYLHSFKSGTKASQKEWSACVSMFIKQRKTNQTNTHDDD